MVALGIAAIVFPMVSTLVATLFVGWVLLISGAVTFFAVFEIRGSGPFFGALLLALLSIAAGVFLIFNPLAGAIALTLMLGAILMFQGAFELFFAFEMRPLTGWLSMLISGLATVVLAILIAAGWPAIYMVTLGILLGVNFLSSGLGYLMVSRVVSPRA